MTTHRRKHGPVLFLTTFLTGALLLETPASADPPVIAIDDSFSGTSIGTKIEYWEDEAKSAGIERAAGASDSFKPSTDSVPNFGYTDSAYWFRFALSNDSKAAKRVILEVGYPLIDTLTSCSKSPSAEHWSCSVSGDSLPFSRRELPFRNVTFSYELDPGQRKTVYLRAQTTSSLRVPLWLRPSNDFQSHIISDELAFGFLFGWLIVLLLYNFLLGLITRDSLYFYYSFFLTSCILFTSSMTGHSFQFLWPDAPAWASRSIPFLVCFFAITSVIFTRFFLHTKKRTPRLDKVLLFLLALFSLAMAASLVGPITLTTRISLLFVFLGAVILWFQAFWVWKIGYEPARFFFLGWLSFAAMVVVAVLRSFGAIPEGFISEQCLNIGAATLALLFGFATGDRLRALIKERQQSREAQLALAAERFHNFSEIKKIADYVSSVSHGVTDATVKLVSSGDAVTSSVEDVSNFADDLSDMVKSIKVSTHRITTAARENMSVALDTTRAMDNTKNEVSLVKHDAELIFETSEKLMTSLSDLENIVSSVGSIAEQSKMLAVNASIESASAGEFGTGFAVIAQEVKNLAQESKEATVEIDGMLSVFKESITDIIQMTRSSAQKTEDSQRSIQHVSELALVLSRAIEANVTMAEDISVNLQNRANSLSHIIKEVSNIEGAVKDNQLVGQKITSASQNLDHTVNHLLGLVGEGPTTLL